MMLIAFLTRYPAGRGQAFAGANGSPLLLGVVEDWVKGVRSQLLQWSTRLLGQEQWQPYSSGQVSCREAYSTIQHMLHHRSHSWTFSMAVQECQPVLLVVAVAIIYKSTELVLVASIASCQAQTVAKNGHSLTCQKPLSKTITECLLQPTVKSKV